MKTVYRCTERKVKDRRVSDRKKLCLRNTKICSEAWYITVCTYNSGRGLRT